MGSIESSGKGIFLPINRIEALTDGVFAIVMTLLVLEFSIPVITGISVNAELLRNLLELWPRLLVYMLTFIILGTNWAHHRVTFHYIVRSDGKLALMNIIFLMFVALTPFSASLLGKYSYTQVAVVTYGADTFLIMLMSLIFWIYVTGKHKLADRDIDPEVVIRRKIMSIVACFFFIIGIGISFVSPTTSLCIYGLAALLSFIIIWRDSHGFLSLLFARTRQKQ